MNNRLSQWFVCSSGVKQGDNLSPTLFSIFINDLVEEVNSLGLGVNIGDSTLSLLLYADDIVLLASSETDMQCMLDKVHEWCKRWRVLINTEKSKVMHFRPSRSKRSEFQFKFGDNLLQITDTYKYLGVTFHDLKDFRDNANRLSEAGGRALGGVISKIHHLKDFGIKTFEKLFTSFVVPVLDYSSSIWGYKDFACLNQIQNKAIRYFLGVHKFAPTLAINGEVGWVNSKERRWCNMIRYWNKLLSMDDTRICKRVFNWDYEKCMNNWSSEVKNIMSVIGLESNFITKNTCDSLMCKTLLKDKCCADRQKSLKTFRNYEHTGS